MSVILNVTCKSILSKMAAHKIPLIVCKSQIFSSRLLKCCNCTLYSHSQAIQEINACIQSTHAPKSYNITLSPNFPAKNPVPLLKAGHICKYMQIYAGLGTREVMMSRILMNITFFQDYKKSRSFKKKLKKGVSGEYVFLVYKPISSK